MHMMQSDTRHKKLPYKLQIQLCLQGT